MKYHLNNIRRMTRKNGKLIVESTMQKAACAQQNYTSDVLDTKEFRHVAKNDSEKCCDHCLAKMNYWNEKAKEA